MCVEAFELMGAAFLGIFVVMTLIWIFAAWKNNAGAVDIGWALCFLWIGTSFLFLGEGAITKRISLSILLIVWSGRLAWHLWTRFAWDSEDPRYTKLLQRLSSKEAENRPFLLYLLFLFQGVLIFVLSLPFYIVFGYAEPSWSFVEVVGLLVIVGAIFGEAAADGQLEQCKQQNRDKVCRHGLWYYSRHPNYFFEWVIWIGFFLFSLGTSFGYLAVLSPILIFVLLTKVSGIPPAEEQALQSRGDAYREYQRTTSIFFPWFPSK